MSAGVGLHAQASSVKSTDKASRPAVNNKVQPTPEQLRLAQISQKSDHDDDLRNKVAMVANLANCDVDKASFALHDCGLDVQNAVNMLLEGGESDYHQQVIRKKKGVKVNSSGEVSEVADIASANIKESNCTIGEVASDRGGRKAGRINAPPRMQPHRGASSASRARGDYRGEYTSQNDAKEGVNNGDVEYDTSVHARGGRGRGRGRGGWHGTRGSRNYSRPGQYDRAEAVTATCGEADTRAAATGSGEQAGLRNHSSGAGGDLESAGAWELEVDEWTGSLKESQVFTARALDSSTPPNPHNAAAGADVGNSGSYGAAAFDGLAAPAATLPSSSLLAGGSIYSITAESGTASHRDSAQLPRQGVSSAADDLSRSVAASISGASTDRVQIQASPFSSSAVEQSLYINNIYDRQLASDTIKHAIGIPTSSQAVPMGPATATIVSTGILQPSQNKVKPSRTKLPPPTKIPTAAVEMPHKASSIPVHALGVQFGNLDLGTETSSSLDSLVREKQPPLSLASKAAPPAGLQATSAATLTPAGSTAAAGSAATATTAVNLQSKASENLRAATEQQLIGASSAPAGIQQQPLPSAAASSSHTQQQQQVALPVAQQSATASPASQSVYAAAVQQASGNAASSGQHHHHLQQQLVLSPAASSAGGQYAAASIHAQPAAASVLVRPPVSAAASAQSSLLMAAATASVSSQSSLPVTSATPFSAASALNPALLANNLNTLPPAASHLYSNYPQMYTPMPPNLGGAGGYSGVQNPAYANLNYLTEGGMYASPYYTDAPYEATALQTAAGGASAGSTGPSSMQSTSAISSTTSTTPTSSGSRVNSTGSKPSAPGLPPGIGLPLQPATATYMNMTGPSHMAMGGGPYFSPMYAFDDYQKLHSLAYYDPSQYQLVGSQAAGPAGAFAVGSDGKLSLMDGQGGVTGASGSQLPSAAVTAAGQQQSGGSSATGGGGMTLQQHYVGGGAGGSNASGTAGAGLHHAYPPYLPYFPAYSQALFPGMHSNTGLNPALSSNTTNVGYPKGSAYGSMYAPTAATAGGAAAAYDDIAHIQDYNKSHMYGSSGQSSVKASANMSSAANGSSGGASVTHSGSSPGDVASMSMYKHGMTQVAAYTHAAANSHMNAQAGGPMSGYNPYLLAHQQQVVLQGALSGQDSGSGGRSGHASNISATGGGSKPLGAASSKAPSYSSASAASWPQY